MIEIVILASILHLHIPPRSNILDFRVVQLFVVYGQLIGCIESYPLLDEEVIVLHWDPTISRSI